MKDRQLRYALVALFGLLVTFTSEIAVAADKNSNSCKLQGKINPYDSIFPNEILSLKKYSKSNDSRIYYVSELDGFDQSPLIVINTIELCKIEDFDEDFNDLIDVISKSVWILDSKSPDLVEKFNSSIFPNSKIGFVQLTTKTGYTQGWIFHDGLTRVSMLAFMYRDTDLAIVKSQIEDILGRVPNSATIMETPK